MSATTAPRALVVGAGSLGTLYGAALARAGLDVQLLARGPHAAAIRDAGHVVVEEGGATWTAPVRATADPREVEPAELVILLTQVQDSAAALAPLRHVRGAVQLAVSLQNGGGTERSLTTWCGPEPVIGGTSMVGATLAAPGVVRATGPGETYVGDLDGTLRPRTRRLAEWLERGGLSCVVTERVHSAAWSKLINAATVMTLTALPRLPLHVAFADPLTSRSYVDLVREAAAIARAAGVPVEDWPGMVPIASLCELPFDDAVEIVARRGRDLEGAGHVEIKSSMLRSVETGRPLEVDAVHGYLVAEAGRLGVDAPMLRLSYAMLKAIDRRAVAAAAATG